MLVTDFWSRLTTLQKVQLCIGIAGLVLAATDFLLNNAAVLIWLGSTIWLGLSTDVQFWHVLVIGVAASLFWVLQQDEEESDQATGDGAVSASQENVQLDPYDYKMDEIKGVLWTWKWLRSIAKPNKPIPLCPKCGMEMEWTSSSRTGSSVKCPKDDYECEWKSSRDEVKDYVKREVLRRVRTGEYNDYTSTTDVPLPI
jgi:hypothetical protein